MLFLDANAFYLYYGRAKLGMTSSPVDETALRHFLDNHHGKSLPTSVFMEIVTHFREDPDKLLKLIRFREQKNSHYTIIFQTIVLRLMKSQL